MKTSKTRWLGVLLALALLLALAPATPVFAATTWYVDDGGGADFTTIQEAVDAAAEGDTIIVRDGTYTENIYIATDDLTIQSENGRASTIVEAADPELDVFYIDADNITIDGFTARGVTAELYAGITILYTGGDFLNGGVIKNNDCSDNDCGFFIGTAGNFVIENNVVSNCNYGAYFTCCSNILFTENTLSANDYGVVLCHDTSSNVFYLNNIDSAIANVHDDDPGTSSGNIWNSPTAITYSYGGSEYTGHLGNYWSDYSGADADGDGIGDTHYQTFVNPVEYDNYPLMEQFENYSVSTSEPPPSDSTTLSGVVPESYVSITVPDYLDVPLERGTTVSVVSAVDIDSNIPWQLNVEDEKEDDKGYMVSTEGDVLQHPMMVNHDTTSIDLSTPGGATLATGAGPQSVDVEFEQQVEYTDPAGTYEITVTFSVFGTF